MTSRFSATLAAVFLFGVPTLSFGQEDTFDAEAALQEVAVLLDETEARLPSVDKVLEETEFDAELLIKFMRDTVQYHPYEGVQRGVEGTLFARSGNSWDQAITLSSLLTEAGYEAFVAYGEISDAAFPAASAADLPGDLALQAEFADLVTARTDDLRAALAEAGVTLGGGDDITEVTYAWVKWRDAPGDAYREVHPIFDQEPDTLTLNQTGSVTGNVPSEMVMSLSVRPFVEIKTGDDLSRLWVADELKGAVANMWGVRQIYAFAPTTAAVVASDLPEASDETLEAYERLVTSSSFIATRNGVPMGGAQHVSRLGALLSPEAAASAMAGVFETVAANTGNAAAALAALGEDTGEGSDAIPQLAGAGFELKLTGPEMSPQIYTRHMLTTDTPVGDIDGWFADITQTFDLTVQPGPEPRDAIAQRTAIDHGALLQTYQELSTRQVGLDEAYSAYDYGDLRSSSAMTAAIPVTSAGRQAAPDTAQSGPLIAALITRIKPDPEFALNEQRRIFDILQRPITGTPQSVLNRGVAESLAERFALSGNQGYGAATLLATESSLSLLTDPVELDALAVADIARLPMLDDLNSGYVIAVSGSTDPALAWWRIDPRTGQTLGRSHAGWGNELTEFLSTMQISFSVTTSILNAAKCGSEAGGGGALGRCVLCLGVSLVGDLAFETGAGHRMATSACSI